MSGLAVTGIYALAAILALCLLYFFEPIRWYWHVISVAAAFAIGLTPMPAQWHTPLNDALTGCAFLLLFVWGVCAPLFRRFHYHRERHA
jgi:hypothetical protein